MKEQILEIAEKLRLELITENQAQDLLLGLFGVSGRFYTDKEIEKIKYLSFLQGTVDGDTEEDKNLEQNLDKSNEKLHISDVSCSIDDIKKWVDSQIGYYDPDDCEWNYTVGQAIEDMLANFKTHFLNIDYTKKFDKEDELIKYFKSEWEQYYN